MRKNINTEITAHTDNFVKLFGGSSDITKRSLNVCNIQMNIVYVQNLVDSKRIEDGVVGPLFAVREIDKASKINYLVEHVIGGAGAKAESEEKTLINEFLSGSVLLFVDGESEVIIVPVTGYEKRAVVEPPTSAVLKGPREGFTENIATNVGLIRRRLKSEKLVVENKKIGRISQTDIAIIYLSNVADKKVINEVKKRISNIDIDGIVDSYYIQSLISDKNGWFFKRIGNTEKPDVVMSKLLEGRIAIVVDGSPIVLTMPYLFLEDLQSGDDYYHHATHSTFVRLIRVFGLMIGILLPGVYVATQIFHYRLLPLNLLISLLGTVQNISFPPLVEILFVLFIFEILNEASVRMPKYLGMALSVIGALVLGDTAVQAGLISPPAVLVVAISGITIYTVPDQVNLMSLLRLAMTIVGGIAGFYGILIGSVFLIGYMCSIESFGVPFLAPYAPSVRGDKKDGVFKKELQNMKRRPYSIPNINRTRFKGGSDG